MRGSLTSQRHVCLYTLALLSLIVLPQVLLAASANTVSAISPTNNPGSITDTGLDQVNDRGRLDRLPMYEVVKDRPIQEGDDVITLNAPDAPDGKPLRITQELHHIQIYGNTVFNKEDLAPIINKFLQSPRTEADVRTLIHEIDEKYYEAGYLTTKTLYAGIENETLKLKVVEGKVSSTKVKGNKFQREKTIRKHFDVEENSLLNLPKLQQEVQAANASQDLYRIHAHLSPGENPGESVLTYEVEERLPYRLSVFSDNRGRPLIGQVRWGAEFAYESPLGLGDELTLGYTGAKGTTIAETAYTVPINDKGTSLGAAYSFAYVDVENRNGPQRLEGIANNYSIFVNQEVPQVPGLSASSGFNIRKIRAYTSDTRTGESDVTSATFGLNWDKTDKYGYTNLNANLTAGMAFWGGDTAFYKYELGATRVFKLPKKQFIVLNGYSMLAGEPLPGFEQMQIGGSSSVRGYTEGLLFGDRGYNVNAEYRFPILGLDKIAPTVADKLQGVIFTDVAQVFVDENTAGFSGNRRDSTFLVGTGTGLRLSVSDYLEGFLDLGVGLSDRRFVEPNAQPAVRAHFGVRSNLIPKRYRQRS